MSTEEGVFMFHRAMSLEFLDGTSLKVRFQDGVIKSYDMKVLFKKYPQLKALKDRKLFTSGKLLSPYGIVWNDELDIETETIYQEGETVGQENAADMSFADAVRKARAEAGISQMQLSELTGIDQSDISKIERGVANPSVSTLQRIAKALGGRLSITIDFSMT
ncbi:MAG: helix-turn-helix domain-containing protein [Clostridia bacterium]|nr:helix-turn-helix domain-containing protein [Clostridia bacterium]